MTTPSVSVVVEAVTQRETKASLPLAHALTATLEALALQTDRVASAETILVLDDEIDDAATTEIRRRFPRVKVVTAPKRNYFSAKNAGAAAASGAIIAMLDGDTVPRAGWLDALLSRFEPGVDVVAGCTRYGGDSLGARTCSVPDFAGVLEEEDGFTTGFNVNNVAFRADVLRAHPLDEQILRHGGCYFLYSQLRAAGTRMVYEPRARVDHGFDGTIDCFRKRFRRGFDGMDIYRRDTTGALRGTRFVRRLGVLAIPPLTMRRLAIDLLRLVRHHRQIGITAPSIPYYAMVFTATRLIEAAGALSAVANPRRYTR